MSGSDLAPFVGAVLRDRMIDEMQNEIDITGTNGTPIHYEESFKNAERCSNYGNDSDYRLTYLCFDDGSSDDLTTDGLPLSSIDEMEIRLGGVVVQRFNIDDADLIICFEDEYDEVNRTEDVTLRHINRRNLYGPIGCVAGIIGPLPLGWRQRHVDHDMVLTDFLELVADDNNLTPQT
ncbi:hypothetical protein FRACYDRAFT_244787 [Fragilariopsis cylindrus CCMP1102]|uniref:Uncharacterized protein n=1 Tax=Fragilariopsis cylindrus CCMP1102 TaxID=635003 RepID=A0A1E7F0D0_9STRA|nr:hypothetical protein FRACYDRAFT_244787 [Fragilariopsis cylindrus CCMP1102]|eukprot:OEU11668.1 hypothetical protein FRACYDRAFT_244787 [Fragilariopsis cylindrus CCMP1102]